MSTGTSLCRDRAISAAVAIAVASRPGGVAPTSISSPGVSDPEVLAMGILLVAAPLRSRRPPLWARPEQTRGGGQNGRAGCCPRNRGGRDRGAAIQGPPDP